MGSKIVVKELWELGLRFLVKIEGANNNLYVNFLRKRNLDNSL
jgi:hypothetical protein